MKTVKVIQEKITTNWFVCRLTSGKKSAQYGIRFSYPLYISLVAIGIFFTNPYILSITSVIALFCIILPMHPFDYFYNYVVTKVIRSNRIPGRGSELQMNSIVALLFNLGVIASILLGMELNYVVLALLYAISSIFFIAIQLSTDNFSLSAISNLLFKRSNN